MRQTLEQHQVGFYLIAILLGMTIGGISPEQTRYWELLLWPVLGFLLYTTFPQALLTDLSSAFRNRCS